MAAGRRGGSGAVQAARAEGRGPGGRRRGPEAPREQLWLGTDEQAWVARA